MSCHIAPTDCTPSDYIYICTVNIVLETKTPVTMSRALVTWAVTQATRVLYVLRVSVVFMLLTITNAPALHCLLKKRTSFIFVISRQAPGTLITHSYRYDVPIYVAYVVIGHHNQLFFRKARMHIIQRARKEAVTV